MKPEERARRFCVKFQCACGSKDELTWLLAQARIEALEEAARVADNLYNLKGTNIAAAIRALSQGNEG